MGRKWYEDGKLLKKKNTFTDFIACAEHLLEKNYGSPDKLCIGGSSAGGLLMGAVMNMRPDLFKVVIARVPFVDVLTSMLDDSIPLTTVEFEVCKHQWASVLQDQDIAPCIMLHEQHGKSHIKFVLCGLFACLCRNGVIHIKKSITITSNLILQWIMYVPCASTALFLIQGHFNWRQTLM